MSGGITTGSAVRRENFKELADGSGDVDSNSGPRIRIRGSAWPRAGVEAAHPDRDGSVWIVRNEVRQLFQAEAASSAEVCSGVVSLEACRPPSRGDSREGLGRAVEGDMNGAEVGLVQRRVVGLLDGGGELPQLGKLGLIGLALRLAAGAALRGGRGLQALPTEMRASQTESRRAAIFFGGCLVMLPDFCRCRLAAASGCCCRPVAG